MNKSIPTAIAAAALLSVLSVPARAAAATTTATAPQPLPEVAPPETQSPLWQQLIADLSSSDFARRQSAQQRLQSLDIDQHDAIQWFWRHTPDPEVQSRLDAALTALENRTCGETPPISLHRKNATFAETVAALDRALGGGIVQKRYPSNYDKEPADPPQFTLDLDQAPYWDVIAPLTRQSPIRFPLWDKPISDPMVPAFARGGWVLRNCQRVRGAIIFVNNAARVASAFPQGSGDAATPRPTLEVHTVAYLDPRLFVVRYAGGGLTLVRDNAGHELLRNAKPPNTSYNSSTNLTCPDNLGDRFEIIQGEYSWEIGTRILTTVYDNISGPGDFPIDDKGDYVMSLTGFGAPYGRMNLTFRLERSDKTLPQKAIPVPKVQITLSDADGRIFCSGVSALTYAYSPPPKLPLRLKICNAIRTSTFRAPFELKDLPIPQ